MNEDIYGLTDTSALMYLRSQSIDRLLTAHATYVNSEGFDWYIKIIRDEITRRTDVALARSLAYNNGLSDGLAGGFAGGVNYVFDNYDELYYD